MIKLVVNDAVSRHASTRMRRALHRAACRRPLASAWFERAAEAGEPQDGGDIAALIQTGAALARTQNPPPVHEWFERGAHEWNPTRFRVFGDIRNASLRYAMEGDFDFYFVADVDNFIRSCTLRELVALYLPVVAPFLRSAVPGDVYSNYHADIDGSGYYKDCDQYSWILNRWVRGVIEVPVIHCAYLVRRDVFKCLRYLDHTERHEYVVFADNARRQQVGMYLDNRQVYGYITFADGLEADFENTINRIEYLLS